MAKIEPISIEEARRILEEAKKIALPLTPEEEKELQKILNDREELRKESGFNKLPEKPRNWPAEVEALLEELDKVALYLLCKIEAIVQKAKEETGGKPIVRNTTILNDPGLRKRFERDGLLDENPWFWEIDESWPPRKQARAYDLRSLFEETLLLTPEQYERSELYDEWCDITEDTIQRLIYTFDPSSRDFYERAAEAVTIFF